MKFFRVADLVGLLEEASTTRNLTRIKKQIEACDLLILDELGYVPFQKQGAEPYFISLQTVMNKSVIVTSNLEFGQWNRIFGDNRLTSALVTVWSIMPISLHLQAKVIVYEMPYLLEILKSRFKKVAASLCTFLCISLHFLLAQNTNAAVSINVRPITVKESFLCHPLPEESIHFYYFQSSI